MYDLDKLVIGPAMVLTESFILGNFLETIKTRQQNKKQRYRSIASNLFRHHGFGAWHRGFYPWGVLQACTKGLPVMFVQSRAQSVIGAYMPENSLAVKSLSGAAAGAAQALFVTPTQRLRIAAMTEDRLTGLNATAALKQVVKQDGAPSLFRGIESMVARRTLDWGIRLTAMELIQRTQRRWLGLTPDQSLGMAHQTASVIGAVMISTLNQPSDTMVARRQTLIRDNLYDHNIIRHIRNIIRYEGVAALYRGWSIRVLDASHHTFWIFVVGGALSRSLRASLDHSDTK